MIEHRALREELEAAARRIRPAEPEAALRAMERGRHLRRLAMGGRVAAGALGAAAFATAAWLLVASFGPAVGRHPAQSPSSGVVPCAEAPTPQAGPIGLVSYLDRRELHVIDLATGADRVVARLPRYEQFSGPVRFSPDGRYLALGDGVVVPTVGGRPCRPLGRVSQWAWSPTADIMAGISWIRPKARGNGAVLLGGPGQPVRRLLPPGWTDESLGVAFDPSGGQIATGRFEFEGANPASPSGERGLWVVDIRTGQATELYRQPKQDTPPQVASWSPDGAWILFWPILDNSASLSADGLPLMALPAAGGQPVRAVDVTLLDPGFLSWCGSTLVAVEGAGRLYAFGTADKELVTTSPPEWQQRPLGTAPSGSTLMAPACSPDSTRVAATAVPRTEQPVNDTTLRSTLWLVDLPDGTTRPLAEPGPGFSDEAPRWSRDGRSILFIRRGVGTLRAHLYLADAASGEIRGPIGPMVEASSGWSQADWYQPND